MNWITSQSQLLPALQTPGDRVGYGSYVIIRIHENCYRIDIPAEEGTILGGMGVSFYLLCGSKKAMVIDQGNNYIHGMKMDKINPRPGAEENFISMLEALAEGRELMAATTHCHPDHIGMYEPLFKRGIPIWVGEGEPFFFFKINLPTTPEEEVAKLVRYIDFESTLFDLGGVTVKPFRVRGHSDGGTIFVDLTDGLLFSGDCIGSGLGQSLRDEASIRVFAQDVAAFVEYIKTAFTPYRRYNLKVNVGHAYQMAMNGLPLAYDSPAIMDCDWLDWRFVQDCHLLAQGILRGDYADYRTGLQYLGANTDAWGDLCVFKYGTATLALKKEDVEAVGGKPIPAV